jgi:hypothetical protein
MRTTDVPSYHLAEGSYTISKAIVYAGDKTTPTIENRIAFLCTPTSGVYNAEPEFRVQTLFEQTSQQKCKPTKLALSSLATESCACLATSV